MAPLLKRTRSQLNALALNRKVSLTPPEEVGSVWPIYDLAREITKTYDDTLLATQPEVTGNTKVRVHRADREAAFIGEVLEVEREESAQALARAENASQEAAALAAANQERDRILQEALKGAEK